MARRTKPKIEIGSTDWLIEHKESVVHEGVDCLGLTEYSDKKISISTKHKDRWAELHTFFHEYYHAAVREYNIHALIEDGKEEEFVETLGLALTLSLKHSPYMREYLKKYL